MKNPNKYIRLAINNALSPIVAYYKRVPVDVDPGETYVVIGDLSKGRFAQSRCGHEWSCRVTLNLYIVSELGMPPSTNLDDFEQTVHNAIRGINIGSGFTTKMVNLERQIDLEEYSETQSIDRRVLTYEIWLNNIEE